MFTLLCDSGILSILRIKISKNPKINEGAGCLMKGSRVFAG